MKPITGSSKGLLKTVPPSTITLQTVTSKFKNLFKRGCVEFAIELHEGVMYVHNSLHLVIEIPYSDAKTKKRIYKALWLLPDAFDFSFTVEAYTIEALEDFVTNCLVGRVFNETAFGSVDQTRARKYQLITDNLHLQTGDHVVDLYKNNHNDISFRRGVIKARRGNLTTVEVNCICYKPKIIKETYECIVTKLTVTIEKTKTEDGRDANIIVAMEEGGVSAWAEFKGKTDSIHTHLIQPLKITMMYRYWYVDILQNCFEVLNKETGELWMVAKHIQDVDDVL